MKILILLISIFGVSAHASQICDKLIPCGTYQKEEEVAGKKILHEMIFIEISATEVKFEIAKTVDGQRSVNEAIMNFNADGTFKVTKAEGVTSAGICLENACSMAIRPYLHNGEQSEQAIVIRFTANSVQLAKLTVDANGKTYPTDVTLTKVP